MQGAATHRGSLHFYGIGLESDAYAQRKPMPEQKYLIYRMMILTTIMIFFFPLITLLLHIISQHNRQRNTLIEHKTTSERRIEIDSGIDPFGRCRT